MKTDLKILLPYLISIFLHISLFLIFVLVQKIFSYKISYLDYNSRALSVSFLYTDPNESSSKNLANSSQINKSVNSVTKIKKQKPLSNSTFVGKNIANSESEISDHRQSITARVSRWPRIVRERKAHYPSEAKRLAINGTVVLMVEINELGMPVNVKAVSGPGYGLNEAAEVALRDFKFSPAYIEDKPIPVVINYKYHFKIE